MRMTATQCQHAFVGARVARLATVNAAGAPHLVPVTFAVIDVLPAADLAPVPDPASAEVPAHGVAQLVVFAVDHKPKSTTALRRLDNIAANPRVAFLVDHYDEDWDTLWWVRVDATAAIIDGVDRSRGIAGLRAKYTQYERVAPHGVVVGAAVQGWSGWRSSA